MPTRFFCYVSLSAPAAPGRGRGKKCAVGISFAFELLDIFIGQWAATFLPGALETDLVHPNPASVPENCQHLSHILEKYFHNDSAHLLQAILPDLTLRGLKDNRISTFCARINQLRAAAPSGAARRGRPRSLERPAAHCASCAHFGRPDSRQCWTQWKPERL